MKHLQALDQITIVLLLISSLFTCNVTFVHSPILSLLDISPCPVFHSQSHQKDPRNVVLLILIPKTYLTSGPSDE